MTADRRLDAVQADLSPAQRVVAWLEEAHAYGSLEGYLASLIDQPSDAFPINRLAREAADAARKASRGEPTQVVNAAIDKALLATLTRYRLVLRANVKAHETVDRAFLVFALLASELGQVDLQPEGERTVRNSRLDACRQAAFLQVDGMIAMAEARAVIEKRFLLGHSALFPDVADEWPECLLQGQRVAVMADVLAQGSGLPAFEPSDDLLSERVAAATAALLEPARAMALDDIDDSPRAFSVARAWVASSLTPPGS